MIVKGAGAGSRNVDQDRLIEVIRLSLEADMLDGDVRRALWLEDGDEVTPAFREVAARKKARAVYLAILAGWRTGMAGSLDNGGGVRIGDMMRLGGRASHNVALRGSNEDCVVDGVLGAVKYKRDTFSNGWYVSAYGGRVGPGPLQSSALLALGWFPSWDGLGAVGFEYPALWYGPLNGVGPHVVPFPSGDSSVLAAFKRWGTKKPDDSGYYAWAYLDDDGIERRVVWTGGGALNGSTRLKAEVVNGFFLELNGIDDVYLDSLA